MDTTLWRVYVRVLGLNFPVRLDVFESRLFWVSEARGMLSTMDKFGRGVNRTLQTGLVRPHAVRLFHARKHDIASTNVSCRHNVVFSIYSSSSIYSPLWAPGL